MFVSSVLRALTLPADRPLALVSFGGYGANGLALDERDCLDAARPLRRIFCDGARDAAIPPLGAARQRVAPRRRLARRARRRGQRAGTAAAPADQWRRSDRGYDGGDAAR
jgi:hypothetical protein